MRVSAVAFFEQFAHSADYRFDRAIATYRDADDDGDLDGYVALGKSSEEGHIQQKSYYNAADAAEAEGYAVCKLMTPLTRCFTSVKFGHSVFELPLVGSIVHFNGVTSYVCPPIVAVYALLL